MPKGSLLICDNLKDLLKLRQRVLAGYFRLDVPATDDHLHPSVFRPALGGSVGLDRPPLAEALADETGRVQNAVLLDINDHVGGPLAGQRPVLQRPVRVSPRPGGMALARKLRERASGTQPVIIFVTGYDRYVFDAFDVGAFHYLLKPVDEEKFARVFARAAEQIMTERKKPRSARVLTLQSANTNRTIPLDGITYIESSNHKVVLHLKDGEFACYAKIRDLELELQGRFFRIHKGYLVNLSYVGGYGKTEVTLTTGERLLLSKYKYQDFVRAYLRFLKEGGGL